MILEGTYTIVDPACRFLSLVDILGHDYSNDWTLAGPDIIQLKITRTWVAMWGPGGIAEQLNDLDLVGANLKPFPVLSGAEYARQIASTCVIS